MSLLQRTSTYVQRLLRFSLVMVAFVGVAAASLAMVGPQLASITSAQSSDPERITLKPLAERSLIFDSLGNEQGVMTNRLDPQNRSQVPLEDIPETVTASVIAVEDNNFYDHTGINVRSILRAVDANLEAGEVSQGGSTITQQVVKNSLVGDDQNLTRKLREAILAMELEKQMSKDDILEYYLNSVYFGGGAYGVQAAAEYYFSKDVGELNWAEGALLAALIRSPNYYNPFNNPDVARTRRDIVFGRLVATDLLTEAEVAFFEQVELPTVPNRPLPPYDYFVEEVKQQLLADPQYGLGATEEARNRAVFEGGIRVHTTFNPIMQIRALQARNETLPANKGDATFDVVDPRTGQTTFGTAAMASIEPSTGAVRSMVGGPGFERYQANLATGRGGDGGRQPGSTMKTFVAAHMFQNGTVPADTVRSSCRFDFPFDDEIRTYEGRQGTIASMMASSSNCGFMALGQVAGIEEVVETTQALGLRGPLDVVPTFPLGVSGATPLEMASAYATFANDGVRHEPYLIERIEDREGRIIYQHEARPQRILDVQAARLVTEVLEGVVSGGTGTRAAIEGGQQAAGKTGTTNDNADIWFVGYTPQLATAVWMGAPAGRISLGSNAELRGATGGRFAAEMWGRYYSLLYQDQPNVDFPEPEATRRGQSVGQVPNQVGRSSRSSSGSSPSRPSNPAPAPAPPPPADTPPATEPAEVEPPPPPPPDPSPGGPPNGPGGPPATLDVTPGGG